MAALQLDKYTSIREVKWRKMLLRFADAGGGTGGWEIREYNGEDWELVYVEILKMMPEYGYFYKGEFIVVVTGTIFSATIKTGYFGSLGDNMRWQSFANVPLSLFLDSTFRSHVDSSLDQHYYFEESLELSTSIATVFSGNDVLNLPELDENLNVTTVDSTFYFVGYELIVSDGYTVPSTGGYPSWSFPAQPLRAYDGDGNIYCNDIPCTPPVRPDPVPVPVFGLYSSNILKGSGIASTGDICVKRPCDILGGNFTDKIKFNSLELGLTYEP